MPRVLTVRHAVAPSGERARYLERLRAKKAHYERAHCRFWVFEETGPRGAFLEFCEAADAETLAAAHAGAPEPVADAALMYREVELS